MAGIPLFLGFLFLFVLIFPKEEKKISSWVKFLVFLPVLVIEIFVPTKYNIEKIEVHEWGIEYEPGIIFWPLFAMILIFVALSCFILIKKYRKSQGIVRERIKYFLLALILSVVIGVGGNFFLPLWGYSRFSVWGPILAITVFNSVIAYSILRYRLMEVCLVVQKGLAYFVSFSILLFLYLGLILILETVFRLNTGVSPTVSAAIAMFAGVYLSPLIINYFKKATDHIFFRNDYEYSEVVNKLSETVNKKIYLDEMLDACSHIVSEALNVDKIVFFLHNKKKDIFERKKKVLSSSEINFNISKKDPIFKYLHKNRDILVAEELELKLEDNIYSPEEKKLIKRTVNKLKKWDVYLCQPVIKKGELAGVLCFGRKKSGKPFSKTDLDLIKFFSNQIVISLENFLVYEETRQKKKELEKTNRSLVRRELRMKEIKKEIKKLKEELKNKNK